MENYKEIQVTEKELVSITCDRCKKEYSDIMEIQEFLHYENDAGYGSVMGDGNILRMDLCQHCTKEVLGEFIRTEGNYIWGNSHTKSFHAHELPNAKMGPKHEDYLLDLLDEELLATHSSFKDDKPE